MFEKWGPYQGFWFNMILRSIPFFMRNRNIPWLIHETEAFIRISSELKFGIIIFNIFQAHKRINSLALYDNHNIGCEPARCRNLLWLWIIIHYAFFINTLRCQTPSPTAFITIPTSVASRQDGIVYYTVTLAFPRCVPNLSNKDSLKKIKN